MPTLNSEVKMDVPFLDTVVYLYTKVKNRFDPVSDISLFSSDKIKNLLIVLTTGLGDAVLSTPAISAVRKRFSDAKIFLFGRDGWLSLFRCDHNLNGVIPYRGKYRSVLNTIKSLKDKEIDLALVFHGNDPDIMPMLYFSGIRFIIRIPNDTTRYHFLLSNREIGGSDFLLKDTHYVVNRMRILKLIGADDSDTSLYLDIDSRINERIKELINGFTINMELPPTLIGYHMFAADTYKMWVIEKHIELLRRLTESDRCLAFFLTGSKEDREKAEYVRSAVGSDRVSNMAGMFDIEETAALINLMDLSITPDTGLLHVAVALKTPTISLFAPTRYELVGAFQDMDIHHFIQEDLICDPCITKECGFSRCMDQITVDEVYELFQRVIKRKVKEDVKGRSHTSTL